jgi:hypothetical protein
MQFKILAHTRMVFALVLVAGFAALTLSLSPGAASAAGGPADVTFTKWITQATAFPFDMKGVVGGDVGAGTYTGEVLTLVDDGTTTKIHALYHINGGTQSLTADVLITQTDATGAAVITGVVTTGYLKDSRVTGGYETLPVCNIATPGSVIGTVCFHGTLHITAGPAPAPTAAPTAAPAAPRPPSTGNVSFANGGEGTSQAVLWMVGIASLGALALGVRRVAVVRKSR